MRRRPKLVEVWEDGNTTIEIYLSNPAGIGEHSDVLEAINVELERMVAADEKIHILVNTWEF